MTADPLFDPIGSTNPVGQQTGGLAGSQNQSVAPSFILVLRDAGGGMCFIGPFADEDDALDYVKLNGINGIYWVLVSELQAP